MKAVRVAVQGCCHGELNVIYQKLSSKEIDLLIITGDFQAIRNTTDLESIAVPPKYKKLGDFYKYYSGEKKAPIPTVLIGGNHESSGYLKELKYGGWVAPNMYYLGEFGAIWYKGLRILGLSGIYNEVTFGKNHIYDEKVPLNPSTLRSIYHIKPKNYVKLLLMKDKLQQRLDIVLSHDWPQYIYHHGDLNKLLAKKPFFKADVESGRLGSPVARMAFNHLTPKYWFSSHLHVKFEAITSQITTPTKNSEEIDLDMDMDMDEAPGDDGAKEETSFLALDKCGRNRQHLEVKTIVPNKDHISSSNSQFYYDARAVAINKAVEEYVHTKKWTDLEPQQLLNIQDTAIYHELEELVLREINTKENYPIPENFRPLAPLWPEKPVLQPWENHQTKRYCEQFNLEY